MEINHKIKEFALIYLAVIILLLGAVTIINLGKTSILAITGFAVEGDESNETIDNETIAIETTEDKGKPEKEEKEEEKEKQEKAKPEKADPNPPPVWKSDVEEFIISGITIIGLNEYFEDKNSDAIGYSAVASEPGKISAVIDESLLTITPAGHNFNSTIAITASDGDKSTTKEVNLIVPEREITINLEYSSGSIYDADNDGVETTAGIIDLTIKNTKFNWDVNENNLCTKWETYSVEDEESTIICYGDVRCCQFVGLLATRPLWDEPFHSSYGAYGSTFNNIASAQVLYVDYDLSIDNPYSEIYSSEWSNLAASYYTAFNRFEDVCVGTCLLEGFNDTSYKLVFEIDGATIELDSLKYTLFKTIDNVLVNLDVEDNSGITSGSYKLYKDDIEVAVADNLVKPDYYDIEVIAEQNIRQKIVDKLLIREANITAPLTADIGIDDVGRNQQIEGVDIKKQYAIDTSEIKFETATLTATAAANALYKCKQWDYSTEVCYGIWEKISEIAIGEKYEIILTADTFGFVEGNLNISSDISELNVSANISESALINNISDINVTINSNATINLRLYFSNIGNDTIFDFYRQGNTSGVGILFENDTAIIVPVEDFIGIIYTFITANKSDNLIISNVFSINVLNITIKPTPPSITELVINITDPLIQQRLIEYADLYLKANLDYDTIIFTNYEIRGRIVIVYMTADDKNIKWVTSLENFDSIIMPQ